MFWARTQNQLITGSLGFVTDMLSTYRTVEGSLMNAAGLTVIRWILRFQYRAVAVDDTINRLALGIVVAPIDDAPPTNAVTSSSNERDWVLWDNIAYVQERQEGTPTQNLMYSETYDIRSARKLDAPGRTPYFLVEAQASDTMDFSWSSSLLVKLP